MTLSEVGQKIEFKGTLATGEEVSNETYQGQPLIVYFYPKANTPGCTACGVSLRDNFEKFEKLGYKIIGVSADSKSIQHGFAEKYEFPFPLIADENHDVLTAFGAWGKKMVFGKEVTGIIRSTFILDGNSVVTHVIARVNTKNHADQLLALIDPELAKPKAAAKPRPQRKAAATRKKKKDSSSEEEESSESSESENDENQSDDKNSD